jgi:hypothetical protein
MIDIKKLRQYALDNIAFVEAGCPFEDPFDTYPPDHYEAYTQPKHIIELLDRLEEAEKYAELGHVALRFADRAGDYYKGDTAETICDEFNKAVWHVIDKQENSK